MELRWAKIEAEARIFDHPGPEIIKLRPEAKMVLQYHPNSESDWCDVPIVSLSPVTTEDAIRYYNEPLAASNLWFERMTILSKASREIDDLGFLGDEAIKLLPWLIEYSLSGGSVEFNLALEQFFKKLNSKSDNPRAI